MLLYESDGYFSDRHHHEPRTGIAGLQDVSMQMVIISFAMEPGSPREEANFLSLNN